MSRQDLFSGLFHSSRSESGNFIKRAEKMRVRLLFFGSPQWGCTCGLDLVSSRIQRRI